LGRGIIVQMKPSCFRASSPHDDIGNPDDAAFDPRRSYSVTLN